jgi:signal transduction histidine kinase
VKAGLPVVYVDPLRINQVVQNLLDNAAKFMGDQSHPRIEIGSQSVEKDENPILYIRDNGIGIEPHQLENVFGLFEIGYQHRRHWHRVGHGETHYRSPRRQGLDRI